MVFTPHVFYFYKRAIFTCICFPAWWRTRIIQDISGNSFRSHTLSPAWMDPTSLDNWSYLVSSSLGNRNKNISGTFLGESCCNDYCPSFIRSDWGIARRNFVIFFFGCFIVNQLIIIFIFFPDFTLPEMAEDNFIWTPSPHFS